MKRQLNWRGLAQRASRRGASSQRHGALTSARCSGRRGVTGHPFGEDSERRGQSACLGRRTRRTSTGGVRGRRTRLGRLYSSREAYSSLLVSGGVLGVAKSMRLCYVTRGAGMRLGVGTPSV